MWTKWTETLFTLRVGSGCVHCVHNVHSVHALLNDSESRLPNLGSTGMTHYTSRFRALRTLSADARTRLRQTHWVAEGCLQPFT